MIINGQLNKKQFKDMQQALNGLALPPKKRQRFLWRMAKYGVIAAAKRNVRNQQRPNGTAWPARQSQYKKKMLRNLPKLLHIKEMPQIDAVRIYLQGGQYRNGTKPVPAGVVGFAQQHGMHVTVRRQQLDSQQRRDPSRLATHKQAKKLREFGYQVKRGKRWRKPTVKQITETLSFYQAGLLIKKLSGKTAKKSWTIDVPARAFLGMSDCDFKKALARQLQGIGFGADVNAQDIK